MLHIDLVDLELAMNVPANVELRLDALADLALGVDVPAFRLAVFSLVSAFRGAL